MGYLVLVIFFVLVLCIRSSISLQVNGGGYKTLQRTLAQPPANMFTKSLFKEMVTSSAQERNKIHSVVKKGNDHHVALLKVNHEKDTYTSASPQYRLKEQAARPINDDIVVTDYQPPHRKPHN